MTRAAIRPLREMTRVVGTPAGGTVLRKASAIVSPGSFRLGYLMLKLRWNAWALAGVSLMSTPRKATPAGRNVRASDASVGASARQGVHHDPQKFIVTAEPGQAEPGTVERGAGDRGRERAVAAPEDRGAAVPRDEALAVAGRCALRDAAARAGRHREGARRHHGCGAAACALEPRADGRVALVTARTSRWTGHRAISYRQ
jgi:hypothetical protein